MDLDKFHQPTLAITRPPTIKHGRLYTEMITTTPEYHKPSGIWSSSISIINLYFVIYYLQTNIFKNC